MEECARGADHKRRHALKDYRAAYGAIANDEDARCRPQEVP